MSFSYRGKRALWTFPEHLPVNEIRTQFYNLFPKRKQPKLKVFHETGATGYKHTHVVTMTSQRVKLTSEKKWTVFRETLSNFNVKPCQSDEHFKNMIDYNLASKKDGDSSTVAYDDIGDWTPPEAYHSQCIQHLTSTPSWKDVLQGPYSAYVATKLSWARDLWRLSRRVQDFQFPSGTAYDWQQHVIDFLQQEPDNRTVHWFNDPDGGNGKTDLSNWLLCHMNAFVTDVCSHKDIAHAYDNQKIVIFDLCRSKQELVPYATMESFKNGRIFSGKYQSCLKTFKVPHVLVFANYPPEEDQLSQDRWNIINLSCRKLSCPMAKSSPSDHL